MDPVPNDSGRSTPLRRLPYEWPLASQYTLALGVVALALLLRHGLDHVVGDWIVFGITMGALLPLAPLIRPGPFLAAAVLAWTGSVFLFLPPTFSFAVPEGHGLVTLVYGGVLALAVIAAWFSGWAQDARNRDRALLRESEGRYRAVAERALAATDALLKGDERLRIAKAAAGLGLHDFDVRTGNVEWDERTRELWGVEPNEPITYEVWRDSLHPEDREGAEAAVRRALDPEGEGQYLAQYRVTCRQDGITRWIEATGQVFFEDGEALRLIGTVQDITDRKTTEEALLEADRRKDEFLATLAHELRNPLAAIRSALAVLERSEGDRAPVERMNTIIDRQSAHLVRLIDDLLDVGRISRGKIELRQQPIDLVHVIDHAVEGVLGAFEEKAVHLLVERPSEPLFVEADEVRIGQVVGNLLSNACKFTARGGEVSLRPEREDGEAVLRVKDSGVGIAPDELGRIFEWFAQVGRDSGEGGLGIGLSLARAITELHGGSLEAHSDGPAQGSEFVLRLPLFAEALGSASAEEAARYAGRSATGATILAVDDNRDALEAVATLLRMSGYTVQTAVDGPRALELAGEHRPEIVLLDIGLPGMDGYEVAKRIRGEPWGREVLLVAMTGWGQEKDKRRARDSGFDAHLTKPVDPRDLERTLNEGVSRTTAPGGTSA